MEIQTKGRASIERPAISRILEHLHRQRRDGRRVFPLVELSEATSIDPGTVEGVMCRLETTGPFDVSELEHGEIRWRVDGCVYDTDDWDCTAWNVE